MLPLAPLLAIAMPVHAQTVSGPGGQVLGCPNSSCVATDPAGLADVAEPGSVLVFPKWALGTVTLDNGAIEPRVQLEIGAVCPGPYPNLPFDGTSPLTCAPHNYEVDVHWVCPGAQVGQETSVCEENDFQVFVSTYGKVVFNPAGLAPTALAGQPVLTGYPALNGSTPVPVPPPGATVPCTRGYAIAFVVNSRLQPLANDVLVGDSIQRNFVGGTDLQSYSAIAIQSVPGNTNGIVGTDTGPIISTVADPDGGTHAAALPFDGQTNHYQMVGGQLWGDVRFTQDNLAPFADTFLILLTLDVRSGLNNNDTHVNFDFYNQREVNISAPELIFSCWTQIPLTTLDPNLNALTQQTPYGMFVTGHATDEVTGNWRTLLGIVQTTEGPTGGAANSVRSYTVRPANDSVPVSTYFVYN